MPQIPAPLIAVLAEVLSNKYTHAELDNRFMHAGFEGEAPVGNKLVKCQQWMRLANKTSADALAQAGPLIEEIMEVVAAPSPWSNYVEEDEKARRERIEKQLAVHGLSYLNGGRIVPSGTSATSITLDQMIQKRDLVGVRHEFERINENLDTDPPAAVTAACALLEALFKSYIADEGLTLPADESVLPLWKVIRVHLGLNPADFSDEHLKKILSGLASTIDGIAGLRSSAGSAHGRDARGAVGAGKGYRIAARHARLAAHSAMSLAIFFIETLEARRTGRADG